MRIPSQSVSFDQKSLSLKRSDFKVSSDDPRSDPVIKKAAIAKRKDMLISESDLRSLATDFKSGTITREEANKRFIETVINNSLNNSLGESDREKLADAIRGFFEMDNEFLTNLDKNLMDLT